VRCSPETTHLAAPFRSLAGALLRQQCGSVGVIVVFEAHVVWLTAGESVAVDMVSPFFAAEEGYYSSAIGGEYSKRRRRTGWLVGGGEGFSTDATRTPEFIKESQKSPVAGHGHGW